MLCIVTLIFSLPSPHVCAESLVPEKIDTTTAPTPHTQEYLPPEHEAPLIQSFGVGLGVPYGVLGGKVELGGSLATGFAGIGIVPIAWDPAVSIGGSVHFLDRYSTVRPKVSVCWSNVTYANLIYNQDNLNVLYKETFPGLAVYAGVDWRPGESNNFEIDLNVGGVIPSTDLNEIKARYERQKDRLVSSGWSISSESSFGTFPKISVGVSYVIGRTLERRYK